MSGFVAFGPAQAISFADLTVESDEDQLAIYGRLSLGADAASLARLDHLIATLQQAREGLASAIGGKDGPPSDDTPPAAPTVPNPFA